MKRDCERLLSFSVLLVACVRGGNVTGAESSPQAGQGGVASVKEMLEARTDVWGDAAMRQPNGASYDFFKDLLPPVRWVNTDCHHYPIVLCAPRAKQKVRLISNGSSINAHG